jgi:hypothetical protein
MSEEQQPDKAWVRISTSLPPDVLIAFCQDAERLLRINSMYEFEEWRPKDDGRIFMRVHNLSNGNRLATDIGIQPLPDGVRIAYANGLKTATEFRVKPPVGDGALRRTAAGQGAVLIVTDDYSSVPKAERLARADEIDKSLVWWGHDLHRYLRQWARWSRFGLWVWYMRRIWQPMNPKARRIAFVLIALTVFELAVGLLAVAGYALYSQ